jgi:transglutaminase-like putative cysteine protease
VQRFEVRHRTEYVYGKPVTAGYTLAYLVPRVLPHQEVHTAIVTADPFPDEADTHLDPFGNVVTYLAVERQHEQLVVTGTSTITVHARPPWPATTVAWEEVPALLDRSPDHLVAHECRVPSPHVQPTPALRDYGAPSFAAGRPIDEAAIELCSQIHRDFAFDPEFSDVTTPLTDVLEHRRGVCQDFAHLAIGCLRAYGLPARYVSGYLDTDPQPGQPKLVGSDASHAWFAVFVPGYGWLDLDPTNDQVPALRHVTVAWGRDYGDVAPVRGVVYGPPSQQLLRVAVDVTRVDGPT